MFFLFSYDVIVDIFLLSRIFILKIVFNNILVSIDLSGIKGTRGPSSFIRGINQILPFISNNCIFISNEFINSLQPDFYYYPFPKLQESEFDILMKEKIINKYIFGPTFVPNSWFHFPISKIWKEKRFSEILSSLKGIVIHSIRVRNYLAEKSNTTNLLSKFIIMRACTNMKPKVIKEFKKRKIDIIFFEKYMDLNRQKQGEELVGFLKNANKSVVKIKYGQYNKTDIIELANNSKFIIYFSFYDTGAIGLKEIQNYGVFSFTLQEDLIINNKTTFYISELLSEDKIILAAEKILKIINIVSNENPKSVLIAKQNQNINKCENALKDLCQYLL